MPFRLSLRLKNLSPGITKEIVRFFIIHPWSRRTRQTDTKRANKTRQQTRTEDIVVDDQMIICSPLQNCFGHLNFKGPKKAHKGRQQQQEEEKEEVEDEEGSSWQAETQNRLWEDLPN